MDDNFESDIDIEELLNNFEKELEKTINHKPTDQNKYANLLNINKKLIPIVLDLKTSLAHMKFEVNDIFKHFNVMLNEVKRQPYERNNLTVDNTIIRNMKDNHTKEIISFQNQIKQLKSRILEQSYHSSPANFSSKYYAEKLKEAEKEIQALKMKIYEIEIQKAATKE